MHLLICVQQCITLLESVKKSPLLVRVSGFLKTPAPARFSGMFLKRYQFLEHEPFELLARRPEINKLFLQETVHLCVCMYLQINIFIRMHMHTRHICARTDACIPSPSSPVQPVGGYSTGPGQPKLPSIKKPTSLFRVRRFLKASNWTWAPRATSEHLFIRALIRK